MEGVPKIKALPDLLINKIAAGEVIERPASVVKELLDNAIDAGASHIAVTIEDGGKRLLRVNDDGMGMSREDLHMCVLPHTTSKLLTEEDLFAITTMGFRGEALASISAVSKMRIVSRSRGSDEANEILVSGKVLETAQATGSGEGTTVEVRDLFFNVPARRKFLRATSTEMGHINEQIARAAFSHPHIAFEVKNNDRITQSLPASQSRLERISKFYGAELATDLFQINREERGVRLEAYVAPPAQSRANANWQYLFINNRYIRDKYVYHAVKEAYRGLMEHTRYAVVFIFLDIDPHAFDVNVHPTKTEVRWSEPNLIHSQVLSALRETFQQCDLTPQLSTHRVSGNRPEVSAEEMNRLRQQMAEALKSTPPRTSDAPAFFNPDRQCDIGSGGSGRRFAYGGGTPAMPSRETIDAFFRKPIGLSGASIPNSERAAGDDDSTFDAASVGGGEDIHYSGGPAQRSNPPAIQLHRMYLVTETEDGIAIIDQHALHERIMYEMLKRRITEGPLEAQRLLLPESLTVTKQQAALLEENESLLTQLGIEITPFGEEAVAVHSFPVLLKDADVVSFMRDLVDQLAQQPTSMSSEEAIHDVLDMMACKAAVKAGDPLTCEEIESLIAQKDLVEKSSNCPHGRPTMLRLTKSDLERQFKRT